MSRSVYICLMLSQRGVYMAFQFKVPFVGEFSRRVLRLKKHVESRGGEFTGDENQGKVLLLSPAGKFAGHYNVIGCTCIITITDKPFIVPESLIR